MLARNCAPEFNTEGENIGAKSFCALKLTLYIGVKQYEGMQISVTRMKDIGHPQAVLLG